MFKPSAQTHTTAPHCGSHCQPAPRVFNTPCFLLLQVPHSELSLPHVEFNGTQQRSTYTTGERASMVVQAKDRFHNNVPVPARAAHQTAPWSVLAPTLNAPGQSRVSLSLR